MQPSEPDAIAPAETNSHPGNAIVARGLRVLCVDDNADAADSLGTLLGLNGCAVAVAHDAISALGRADEFRPQVCVLDITMPGMDGCELARRLRERPDGERLLLVALTARSHYQAIQEIADSGFDLYFAKPVDPMELYAALNRFAEKGRPPT
jgi:CheY-like chemotaxis protein